MRTFSIECTLDLPTAALWQLRGTRRFMDHLVSRRALARMTASDVSTVRERGPDGTPGLQRRTFLYVPTTIEIPDIVKSVFSDSYLELADECTWVEAQEEGAPATAELLFSSDSEDSDDVHPQEQNDHELRSQKHRTGKFKQSFVITPGVMADFISTKGELAILPDPNGHPMRCRHILSGTCNVSIPFLGYYVEEAIVANMHSFYNAYPGHIEAMYELLIAELSAANPDVTPETVTAEDLVAAASRIAAQESDEREARAKAEAVVAAALAENNTSKHPADEKADFTHAIERVDEVDTPDARSPNCSHVDAICSCADEAKEEHLPSTGLSLECTAGVVVDG